MRVADVKFTWTRSPSADVSAVKLIATINGNVTESILGPEVEEFVVTISASSSFQFQIVTMDSEGNHSSSEVYSATIGDLESPLPATNLHHEIVGVREVS